MIHTRLDSTIESDLSKKVMCMPSYFSNNKQREYFKRKYAQQWESNASYGLRVGTRLRRGCPRRKADKIH